jgi:transcriptional antiterminator Rof (Rho-off)
MSLMRQDEIGSCDFLDVLEEAAVVKRPIAVKLRDGQAFIDEVKDVVTQGGTDFVEFLIRGRVPVRDILGASRAEPPRH